MFFNSYEFLFGFLPAVSIVYFLLRRFPRAGTWWMAAASLFFYARYRVDDVALLVASILGNYLISQLIVRRVRKRGYLILGISVNLLVLAVFKYSKNLAPFLQNVHLAFPLGISFFTFSQIAYLVDVYKGVDRPSPIRDYALFVSFFPHLLSGPILRHKEMVPQFDSALRRRPVPRYIARGFSLIVIGLVKKILVADTLAPLVARAFDSNGALPATTAWIGTTAYTFQLYNDFSGYCDIAVGVSYLFNIRIPENFRAPYRSTSIREFWQRWHITLGTFCGITSFSPCQKMERTGGSVPCRPGYFYVGRALAWSRMDISHLGDAPRPGVGDAGPVEAFRVSPAERLRMGSDVRVRRSELGGFPRSEPYRARQGAARDVFRPSGNSNRRQLRLPCADRRGLVGSPSRVQLHDRRKDETSLVDGNAGSGSSHHGRAAVLVGVLLSLLLLLDETPSYARGVGEVDPMVYGLESHSDGRRDCVCDDR